MSLSSTPTAPPEIPYPALVGRALAEIRDAKRITQASVAEALGLSQSAYSRLEAGNSILNISQLRRAAVHIGAAQEDVLALAHQYEEQLRRQGVKIVEAKPDNAAAVAIGLGLLAALILSRSG